MYSQLSIVSRELGIGLVFPNKNLHHCNSSPACNLMVVPLKFILGKDNSDGNMANPHSHSPEHHHRLSAELVDVKYRRDRCNE